MPGDGIGPELTEATLEVLEAVQRKNGIGLNIVRAEAGDECYKKRGAALPSDTLDVIKSSDTCLKGPVGETAADVIVKLRLIFDLYANIRPIKAYPKGEGLTIWRAVGSKYFLIILFIFILYGIAHHIPTVYAVVFSTSVGIPEVIAVIAIGVIGGSAALGRVVMGYVSDKIGGRYTLLMRVPN
jgi:hypothetical protein